MSSAFCQSFKDLPCFTAAQFAEQSPVEKRFGFAGGVPAPSLGSGPSQASCRVGGRALFGVGCLALERSSVWGGKVHEVVTLLLVQHFLVFGLSYVPSVTLAQTDEQAQPPADQTEEGMGVDDGAPTPDDGNPADEAPPEDDVTPPDEDEDITGGASESQGE